VPGFDDVARRQADAAPIGLSDTCRCSDSKGNSYARECEAFIDTACSEHSKRGSNA
jgi:hypothetical protein